MGKIKKDIIYDYIKSILLIFVLFYIVYKYLPSLDSYIVVILLIVVESIQQLHYYLLIDRIEKQLCKSEILFYDYRKIIITSNEIFLPKYNKLINNSEIASCYLKSSFIKSIIINTNTNNYKISFDHFFVKWYPFDLLNDKNSKYKTIINTIEKIIDNK